MAIELILNPNFPLPGASAGVDDPSMVNLTPEGILMYCQSQIGDIDNDIKAYMENQKAVLKKKEILGTLKNEISLRTPPANKEEAKAIADAYAKAYSEMAEAFPGDPLLEDIGNGAASVVSKWANPPDPNNKLCSDVPPGSTSLEKVQAFQSAANGLPGDYKGDNKECYTKLTDAIGEKIEEIKGNAELQMIQLQSMVSARQTAVQLATNMLSKVDQTLQSVVSNIK